MGRHTAASESANDLFMTLVVLLLVGLLALVAALASL